ncbi:MAG: DEAD/DEAH box helicase [Chromatiales bacterium]|nr:DEAD/DEAH box helicase [Gammaproteobacteria bacterium]MCP5352127.1 DEAD/DEAH box helicase [Chromatiales bacterium]
MPILPSHDDIRFAVGKAAYERGQEYSESGRVAAVEVVEDKPGLTLVAAETFGSGGRYYHQRIQFTERLRDVGIKGECTCPVGSDCKHVAAVSLEYLRRNGEGATEPKPVTPDAVPLEAWLTELAASDQPVVSDEDEGEFIAFVLSERPPARGVAGNLPSLEVQVRVTRRRHNSRGMLKGRPVPLVELRHGFRFPDGASEEQIEIVAMLIAAARDQWQGHARVEGELAGAMLSRMLDAGIAFWDEISQEPLAWGAPRKLSWQWRERRSGSLALLPILEPGGRLLATDPPLYVDPARQIIGPADEEMRLTAAQRRMLRKAPELPVAQAEALSLALLRDYPQLPVPMPVKVATQELRGLPARPHLRLGGRQTERGYEHVLLLSFDYGDHTIPALPKLPSVVFDAGGEFIELIRDGEAEDAAVATLVDIGFAWQPASDGPLPFVNSAGNASLAAVRWSRFLEYHVPQLERAGWRIDHDKGFRLRFDDADWEGEVEDGGDWFSLRFDLEVDGRRLPLAPLVAPLIQDVFDLPPEEWPEFWPVPLDGHRYLNLPSARLRPVLEVLRELHQREMPFDDEGKVRLSRFELATLADLPHDRALRGAKELRVLAEQLRDFAGIEQVDPPEGLDAELRPYQRRGLDWLQFLRTFRFNGILADDMGLGKTLQTLAHLLIEKRAGRLDGVKSGPALVVAPTSLMGNWRREAARFTPDLKVLVLHGSGRHSDFDHIEDHDVLLTTYPLLPRDAKELRARRYHSVILDEAQTVKNPRAKAAQIVRDLRCDHRLCLTGTPMENHLGELWSLFDFLMPGFLGDMKEFTRHYRTPIEKHGDIDLRDRLARRVQPFLLRRGKQEVAAELPPKTEILRTIEFAPQQAQLYESIRVAMDKRVREAIASQGLARSHITILDALLKLRQTCCDPRLLKLAHAERVTGSAKMELLMDLLPEQLEEGRRVLLFSQFTQMLGLIEEELKARGIRYAKLTGQTRDRDAEIDRFRNGEVDLFLISLKAGGVGLNLVEADTVILYDPWWNPAVEAQAADRAHRIGQDKPVFVYKLVIDNSVEEKMLAMQERKRALAAGVYSESRGEEVPLFDSDTLQDLFAPL